MQKTIKQLTAFVFLFSAGKRYLLGSSKSPFEIRFILWPSWLLSESRKMQLHWIQKIKFFFEFIASSLHFLKSSTDCFSFCSFSKKSFCIISFPAVTFSSSHWKNGQPFLSREAEQAKYLLDDLSLKNLSNSMVGPETNSMLRMWTSIIFIIWQTRKYKVLHPQ